MAKVARTVLDWPVSASLLAFAVLVYNPLLVQELNRFGHLPLDPYAPAAALAILLLAPALFLRRTAPRASRRLEAVLGAAFLYVVVACNFLPLQPGLITGALPRQAWSDLVPPAALAAALAVVGWRWPVTAETLVRLAGLHTLVMTASLASRRPLVEPPNERHLLAQLGTERNVMVVVLDGLPGHLVSQFLAADAATRQDLDGFTFYPNAAAATPHTQPSTYVIGTGKLPGRDDHRFEAAPGDDVLSDGARRGFAVRYFGLPVFKPDARVRTVHFWAPLGRRRVGWHYSFVVASALRYLPAALIGALGRHLEPLEVAARDKLDARDSLDWLVERVAPDPRTARAFVYFHSLATHFPVRFDRQGRFHRDRGPAHVYDEIGFAFDRMRAMFARMRRLGVYDNTDIFLISDHGYYYLEEFPPSAYGADARHLLTRLRAEHQVGSYDVMMLVKPRGARGDLRRSDVVVSHLDLRRTLNERMAPGSGAALPGVDFVAGGPSRREVPILRFAGTDMFPKGDRLRNLQRTEGWRVDRLTLPHRPDVSLNRRPE